MGKRVAVLTKDTNRQFEALRTGLGLLLEHHCVSLFVLNHEIDLDEHYLDNLGFIDEMGGERYSNNRENVDRHGFKHATPEETVAILTEADIVIPF